MKNRNLYYLFLIIAIIEGIFTVIATLTLQADPKNIFFLGLSKARLLIIFFLIILILCFSVMLYHEKRIQGFFFNHFNSYESNKKITAIGLIASILLWATIFTPSKNFNSFEASFIRIRPALIWLELLVIQFVLWIKISKRTIFQKNEKVSLIPKEQLFIFLSLFFLWCFIAISKIGLISNTAYWNVPGIPLSVMQFTFILFFLIIWLIFSIKSENQNKNFDLFLKIIIPTIIYFSTVIIWGSTPLLRHHFSLEPTPPNFQPFPYSDARIYDLGALSIVMGKGTHFFGGIDKPLFMLFLAILHFFAENDYVLLQWAQIFVLALTPVLLYIFGKKVFGTIFGLSIAVIFVLQQRNSIILSYTIDSINPKLLMPEGLMIFGIVLITFVLFDWMNNPKEKTIFLLGGLIGTFSLVRINPIFLAPVVVIIILKKFWKVPRTLFRQIILLGVAFSLVFSPWMIMRISEGKQLPLINKIEYVLNNRYPRQIEDVPLRGQDFSDQTFYSYQIDSDLPNEDDPENLKQEMVVIRSGQSTNITTQPVWIILNHFLHNFSTPLLSLPDSIVVYDLIDLSSRAYWRGGSLSFWDGNFPMIQHIFIIGNLLILSTGISHCWKKFKWAGLAPLIVFLIYNLSLSLALSSGGRYIVPINWIFFFYYALGLILALRFILSRLGIKVTQIVSGMAENMPKTLNSTPKSLLPFLVIFSIIACLLPAADLVLPFFIHSDQDTIRLDDFEGLKRSEEDLLVYGKIIYPYYTKDGSISFVFLDGLNKSNHKISQEFIISPDSVFIQNGEQAILKISNINGKKSLSSLYLFHNKTPYLFWNSIDENR